MLGWFISGAQCAAATTMSTSAATPPGFFFSSSTGPSTVLVLVLGNELLCGLCASPVRSGGDGAAEVSSCDGGLVDCEGSNCEVEV